MPDRGACTVIVGCQWGDEGKGKIVDVLAEDVDIVARYQGGANAGHTVTVADDEFVLHQIPSGILHQGKRCLLGNGVVLDIQQFFQEFDALLERGINLEGRVGLACGRSCCFPITVSSIVFLRSTLLRRSVLQARVSDRRMGTRWGVAECGLPT